MLNFKESFFLNVGGIVCTNFCDGRTGRKQYDKIISTGNALVNLCSMKYLKKKKKKFKFRIS